VELQARTAVAMVVTIGAAVACLAAVGLAVGALAPSGAMAQTVSIAAAVVVAFLSGVMTIGMTTPAWMEAISSAFPIRHLVRALRDQFDPFATGAGWDPVALAVFAAWGVGGVAVAAWALRREPSSTGGAVAERPRAAGHRGLAAIAPGRPSPVALVLGQHRWASTTARRDVGWVAFAVGMPVGLYALMATQMAGTDFVQVGVPFVLFFAVGMAAYGAAITAFLNMPESMATARDRGLLKRLRGTPLAPWQYLAGRTTAVLWIAILTGALVFATGMLFFGVVVPVAAVPLALVVFLLGTLTLAACGYALAALAPSGRALGVIGLAILLPLSFVSDIFPIGGVLPEVLTTVGSLFPLRHFVHALSAAVAPSGPTVAWANLAVMAIWLIGAGVVAVRRFNWEPRR
jgi:ABC-2 type transport system permease protein